MLPFVRIFCGSLSDYLWEDNYGNAHVLREGSEQILAQIWINAQKFSSWRFFFSAARIRGSAHWGSCCRIDPASAWDIAHKDNESPVGADNRNVRPRLGHSAPVSFDALEKGRRVGSRNMCRSECQGTVIDVDTEEKQVFCAFLSSNRRGGGLERDLVRG